MPGIVEACTGVCFTTNIISSHLSPCITITTTQTIMHTLTMVCMYIITITNNIIPSLSTYNNHYCMDSYAHTYHCMYGMYAHCALWSCYWRNTHEQLRLGTCKKMDGMANCSSTLFSFRNIIQN